MDSAKWSKLTWIKWCPPKINAFIWKLLLDRIPTRVNLRKRKILHELVSPCCFLCNEDVDETSSHLFFNCSFSSKIWSALGNWLDTNITMMGDAKEHLEAFSNLCPKKSKELWLSLWQWNNLANLACKKRKILERKSIEPRRGIRENKIQCVVVVEG